MNTATFVVAILILLFWACFRAKAYGHLTREKYAEAVADWGLILGIMEIIRFAVS